MCLALNILSLHFKIALHTAHQILQKKKTSNWYVEPLLQEHMACFHPQKPKFKALHLHEKNILYNTVPYINTKARMISQLFPSVEKSIFILALVI